MGGRGPVALGQAALLDVMNGYLIDQPDKLKPGILGRWTINQNFMAVAAGLFDLILRPFAVPVALRMLSNFKLNGLRGKEQGCPSPHEEMYWWAYLGCLAAGIDEDPQSDLGRISALAADLIGGETRQYDLITTPDGDVRGLCGTRAPLGANLGRFIGCEMYREIRRMPHRGPSGRVRKRSTQDTPVEWMSRLLDRHPELLTGPLSPIGRMPNLMLGLTVHRWDGGTLCVMADPGDERRREFVATGSAAAKRQHKPEHPVTWIKVEWGRPAKHIITAGQMWESPLPEVPEGAEVTKIEGTVA